MAKKVPRKTRQKAILELMNQGITSPTEIVRRLESDYDIQTTRQTVYRDISDGVEPITEDIIEDHKASMVDNLNELMSKAYDLGMKGNTTAMKTYGQLVTTKAQVLKKIVEIQDEIQRKERPIYKIQIGDFDEAKDENKEKEEKGENKDGKSKGTSTESD